MSDIPMAAKLTRVVAERRTDVGEAELAPALSLHGVGVSFGQRAAVRDVNLDIPSGRITGIIGPSGCGKTTVLRALNRMHDTVRSARVTGSVRLGDVDIYGPGTDPVIVRTRVGMVFQRPNPFPTLSIYDNVVAGLRLNGVRNKSVLDHAAEESLRAAALWDRVSDGLRGPALRLSGGSSNGYVSLELSRFSPRFCSWMSPPRPWTRSPLRTLRTSSGNCGPEFTIVIVTHSLQQAARVSDHCAFMMINEDRIGTVVEAGTTVSLFNAPRDKRTEEYVTGRFG